MIFKQMISFFKDKEVAVTFIYLLLMVVTPLFGFIAVAHLMCITLIKGKEWYYKGLIYFALLKHLNPIFHPPDGNFFVLFVLLLAVVLIFKKTYKEPFSLENKFYIQFLLFAITSLLGSLYIGFSLIRISILCLFVFVFFRSINQVGHFDIVNFLVRITGVVIYASVPLIFMESGYLVVFFKGIFNHSQDFALLLLPLFMIYLIAFLERRSDKNSFNIITLVIGFTELVLSASRSAVIALLVALSLYILLKKHNIIFMIMTVFFIAFLSLAYTLPSLGINQKVDSFFLKYDQGENITIEESIEGRVYLVEVSKQNFFEHPLTGIGFNVQTYFPPELGNPNDLTKFLPGTDIMYSRPLEKGNLYASVFEEGGLITGLYFLYLLVSVFWLLYQSGLPYTWVSFLAMLLNFNGEASLFATLGPGNFQILILITLYALAKKQQLRRMGV